MTKVILIPEGYIRGRERELRRVVKDALKDLLQVIRTGDSFSKEAEYLIFVDGKLSEIEFILSKFPSVLSDPGSFQKAAPKKQKAGCLKDYSR